MLDGGTGANRVPEEGSRQPRKAGGESTSEAVEHSMSLRPAGEKGSLEEYHEKEVMVKGARRREQEWSYIPSCLDSVCRAPILATGLSLINLICLPGQSPALL